MAPVIGGDHRAARKGGILVVLQSDQVHPEEHAGAVHFSHDLRLVAAISLNI